MPIHDFATVEVFEGDDLVEVFFPKDPALETVLRGMKGRWNPQRRCWGVVPRFARRSPAEITQRVRETLFDAAPEAWRRALPQVRALACLSKGYEIYAGPGGIRVGLPPGHPAEYRMKEIKEAMRKGQKWLVPAAACGSPILKQVLKRMIEDDARKFKEWMEPALGRCLVGDLRLATSEEAERIVPGAVLIVDQPFLKRTDPGIADCPLREYAMSVGKSERIEEDIVRVRLDYLDLTRAYPLLRERVYADSPTPAVGAEALVGEWLCRKL